MKYSGSTTSLKTFAKGGLHPPDNKLSKDKPITAIAIPAKITIPVLQHIGSPAIPVVNKKDRVKVGQLIAKSGGFVSANIHSPVSGTITGIDEIIDASGYKRKAILIDVEGDEWDESIDRTPEIKRECEFDIATIIEKVSSAGIVGLGGATFPTHVKLSIPTGKKAEVLIINGVECEPYLTSDHRLMLEKGEEILIGTSILMKALQVSKAYIGIENNKPDAIEHLNKLCKQYSNIQIVALKVRYPQGGEKQLIKAITGREVPSGALPVDVGAVVQNVGTAFAVYEAVQKNKPLIERVVTVVGKSLTNSSNFLVRMGTPISALIAEAGGLPNDTGKIINGGPMMGKALGTIEISVTKGMSGLVVLPSHESQREQVMSCIRCAKCISVCPMGLEPYLLMILVQKRMYEQVGNEAVLDCIECGSCSYTCPSNRPLLDYIRLGKAEYRKLKTVHK